jgi:N-acetylmuramoyl-L-alanine amidase
MTISGWSAIGCLLLAASGQAQPEGSSASSAVTSIRFWSLGDVTRVVIETSGETRYRSERIDRPDRVFFDLQARYGKKPKTLEVSDRLVKQIRVAETQPKVTRVVFDLENRVEYSASQLTNPDRLVIELRRPGAAPAAAPLVSSVAAPGMARNAPPQRIARFEPSMGPRTPAPGQDLVKLQNPPRVAMAAPASPRFAAPSLPGYVKPKESAAATAAAERVARETIPDTQAASTAAPARRNSNGGRSMTRVLGLKIGRVVIDPGHGGHDHGTTGPNGLTEKELVLDVAKRLGALVEDRMGGEVIYTRSDDTFVPLEQRTALANQKKCDLFISIHANSSPLKSASGVETYYLNFTTAKDALEVAARENASSQKSVFELKDLLQKIAMKDKVDESREFAARVQAALSTAAAKGGTPARNRGVKRAPFVVLIGASMPSILTEIGFVSNPREEALLKKADHRQRLAEAIYKGVAQYAGTLSHFQVARSGR